MVLVVMLCCRVKVTNTGNKSRLADIPETATAVRHLLNEVSLQWNSYDLAAHAI